MYCPHCKEEITSLNYTASYSERCYGHCNGTYDLNDEDHCIDDSDQTDSDSWEEDEYEYECPECDHSVDIDELLETIDEKELKKIEKQKKIDDKKRREYLENKKEIDKSLRLLQFFKR